MRDARIGRTLFKQFVEIEAPGEHCQLSIRIVRPIFFGTIPVQLDAVSVGISQVQSFAHPVIGSSVKRDARVDQTNKAPASSVRVGYRIAT
jgi:hypothetical protein